MWNYHLQHMVLTSVSYCLMYISLYIYIYSVCVCVHGKHIIIVNKFILWTIC